MNPTSLPMLAIGVGGAIWMAYVLVFFTRRKT